jgi:hypothetical protein
LRIRTAHDARHELLVPSTFATIIRSCQDSRIGLVSCRAHSQRSLNGRTAAAQDEHWTLLGPVHQPYFIWVMRQASHRQSGCGRRTLDVERLESIVCARMVFFVGSPFRHHNIRMLVDVWDISQDQSARPKGAFLRRCPPGGRQALEAEIRVAQDRAFPVPSRLSRRRSASLGSPPIAGLQADPTTRRPENRPHRRSAAARER